MSIGFDAIGSNSIGEISGGADVIVTTSSLSVSVATVVPVIRGGGSVSPSNKTISILPGTPVVSGGCKIIVPSASVVVALGAVPLILGNNSILLPSKSVVASVVAPKVLAGVVLSLPSKSVVASVVAPKVVAGTKISVPSASVTIVSSRVNIAIGNTIDAVNTISVSNTYGEIGSSSIGSGAIGEADEPSTRTVKIPIFVVITLVSPKIVTGVAIKPPSAPVSISSARPELYGRARKLRILAIAS